LLYGAGKAIIDFFASGGQGDNPPAPGISDEIRFFGIGHGLMQSIFLKNRGGRFNGEQRQRASAHAATHPYASGSADGSMLRLPAIWQRPRKIPQ
jgi:hypothetical protein